MRRALVVGCSANVWEEVEAAKKLCEYDAIYCVKQIGIHWPGMFQVWATLHPEFMDAYEKERQKLGLPNGYEIVAPPPNEVGAHGAKGRIARRVAYRWKHMNSSAGSGIYGAKVALDDGFNKVVLAGIPMTPEDGHFLPMSKNGRNEVRGKVWRHHSMFVCGLNVAIPHLMGRVRSMSGFTEKVLGRPDESWLSDNEEGSS